MSANDTARTPEPFVYRLEAVAKVVDGDTVDLDLDLGFSITLRQRVRLYGIDAPEVHTKDPIEKAKGLENAYLFVVGHSFLAEGI
jgi:micrococcal nuclease